MVYIQWKLKLQYLIYLKRYVERTNERNKTYLSRASCLRLKGLWFTIRAVDWIDFKFGLLKTCESRKESMYWFEQCIILNL